MSKYAFEFDSHVNLSLRAADTGETGILGEEQPLQAAFYKRSKNGQTEQSADGDLRSVCECRETVQSVPALSFVGLS